MTEITLASTAGFCFGVKRAADLVEQLLADGKRVATLGPLIHNRQYTDDLKRRGVVEIASPDEAPDGAVLVLRTHGVTADVLDAVREAGLDYLDAACPFVQKIHRTVTEKGKDAVVVIAGDPDHPVQRDVYVYALEIVDPRAADLYAFRWLHFAIRPADAG